MESMFSRGERRKYAGKKVRFYRGSNSQPLGHESDTLTSKPHVQIVKIFDPCKTAQTVQSDMKQYFFENPLTLSAIYTHFKTLKKTAFGKHCGKGEIAHFEQFHLFPQCFPINLYLKIL